MKTVLAEKLRAWWWHRQGLDGSLAGRSAAEVLERSGWSRSVGGVGPYLTLFARAGIRRAEADAAAAALQIHELPSARGCTYVLPASDFALGLTVGEGFDGNLKVALKLGVTEQEIVKLEHAVLAALARGPLDPESIRAATGTAARNLGDEGKKKGVTTTLPLALGRLQSSGSIRRMPVNGRLDQQRYQYTLWNPNPRAASALDADQANTQLARRYFRWTGPATLAEFQWFSALGVKAAKAVVAPLGLIPLEDGSERLMFAEDREAFEDFEVPEAPQIALVSGIDAIVLLRRDHRSLLEARDLEREVFGDDSAAPLGGISDLPSHAILDRGRIVGLWEFDPETKSIAWDAWVKHAAVKDSVARTEAFVRDDLGDARSFSLDSPKSRAPRIAALRGS